MEQEPARSHCPWTKSETTDLLAYTKNGDDDTQIAERLHRTPRAVHLQKVRLGKRLVSQKRLSIEKAAAEVGLQPNDLEDVDVVAELTRLRADLRQKRVLILDTETSGLPLRQTFDAYPDPTHDEPYDGARILEIAFCLVENWDAGTHTIYEHIRRPTDRFVVSPGALQVHGISYDAARARGVRLSRILNERLIEFVDRADVIVGHNVAFDWNILLNEVHRLGAHDLLARWIDKPLACTCKASDYRNLSGLYFDCFGCKPVVCHHAGSDVRSVLEILLQRRVEDGSIEFVRNPKN